MFSYINYYGFFLFFLVVWISVLEKVLFQKNRGKTTRLTWFVLLVFLTPIFILIKQPSRIYQSDNFIISQYTEEDLKQAIYMEKKLKEDLDGLPLKTPGRGIAEKIYLYAQQVRVEAEKKHKEKQLFDSRTEYIHRAYPPTL